MEWLVSLNKRNMEQETVFPKKIEINPQETFFSIEWSDGSVIKYSVFEIQKRCPCMRCSNGIREVSPNSCLLKIEYIGSYGLKFHFTEGCSFGIYPFGTLRNFYG